MTDIRDNQAGLGELFEADDGSERRDAEDVLARYTPKENRERSSEEFHCEHCGHPEIIAFNEVAYNFTGDGRNNRVTYFRCSDCGVVTGLHVVHYEQRVCIERMEYKSMTDAEWNTVMGQ